MAIFPLVMGFLFFGAISPAHAENLTFNSKWGKAVATCKENSGPRIWFFKQWHLAPSVNTSDIEKSKTLPQYENQTAIYDQLKTWISSGKLKTVIAEGCSGEMTPKTDAHFNGWNMTS